MSSKGESRNGLWLLPALAWLVFFLLVPLTILLVYAFSKRGSYGGVVFDWNVDNFVRSTEWIYLSILGSSLQLAAMTTVVCLLVGYPMAYAIVTAPARWRVPLLTLLIIPFWTNFVIRTYALKAWLGDQGPLAQVFGLYLGGTDVAVAVGMVTNYLPFMVLPLYVALEKLDFTLLEAARDLGADSRQVIQKVLLPQTRRGIVTGSIFVFAPALGEFVIPDILGGAKNFLAGNLITEQFLRARDWPFGAAVSMILIGLVGIAWWLYIKFGERNAY